LPLQLAALIDILLQRFMCAFSSQCDEFDKVEDDDTREWIYGVKDIRDRQMLSERFLFYVFHVKNPREVVEQGAVPALEERGPYGYARILDKMNIAFLQTRYLQDTSFTYTEAYYYSAFGPGSPTNGTDACQLFHATTGVRQDDEFTHRNMGSDLRYCQDDTEKVTLLNVQFLEVLQVITPTRLMADLLQKFWADAKQELIVEFVKDVKLRMFSEVLDAAVQHQLRLRVPMMLKWAWESLIRQQMLIDPDRTYESAQRRALLMFRDDSPETWGGTKTGQYLDFDCGYVNITADLPLWTDEIEDSVELHEKAITNARLGMTFDARLPYRTIDDFGCPWSVRQYTETIEPLWKPKENKFVEPHITGLQTEFIFLGKKRNELTGDLEMDGEMDPRSIMTETGAKMWLMASYNDADSKVELTRALCTAAAYNLSDPGDVNLCGNQLEAILEVFYRGNHSWANHSATRESFLTDMVYTKRKYADLLHCAPTEGPGLLTKGVEVWTTSGVECNLGFAPFMADYPDKTRTTFRAYYPHVLRNEDENTLSPELVDRLFTKGTEVSLLQFHNTTYWNSAMRYCAQVKAMLPTDCKGMFNDSRIGSYELPKQFAIHAGLETDFLASADGIIRNHYIAQVCSVADWLKFQVENSTFTGDTVAILLNETFHERLNLDMATHEDLNRLGYAQFGTALISHELFDGARSVADMEISQAERPWELPVIADAYGWSNVTLSWEDAQIALDGLSNNFGDHGFVEDWLLEHEAQLLGSALNSVLINHTFSKFGVLNLAGDPKAGEGRNYVDPTDENATAAPTAAPTVARDPLLAHETVSLLTGTYVPRNCAGERSGLCTAESPFGATARMNTTLARLLTVFATRHAHRDFFINQRLWCIYPTNCDYLKGGMFKEVRVRDFLWEGYTDSFLSKRAIEATKSVPTAAFECQKPGYFVELDMTFVYDGLITIEDDAPRAFVMPDDTALPKGFFYVEDKQCAKLPETECGHDGFQIVLPTSVFAALSTDNYNFDRSNANPFFYDATVTQTHGYHDTFTGMYPRQWELYEPEIGFPVDKPQPGDPEWNSGTPYIEKKIPNPWRALFLGKTIDDIIYHRSKACGPYLETWGGCQMVVDSGVQDIRMLGRLLLVFGNRTNSFYEPPKDHPLYLEGGIRLNTSYLGYTLPANLWEGFKLPKLPDHVDILVKELWLPFRMFFSEAIYVAYAPQQLPETPLVGELLDELRGDKPGVEFTEVALDVYCATNETWELTSSAANATGPQGSIHLRGVGYGMDSPYYLSPPHYLYHASSGDPSAREHTKYTGLQPKEKHHRTCYKFEPITGEVFSQEQRYQTNFRVPRSMVFPNLREDEYYFPVIWHERGKVITADDAFAFHNDILVFPGLQTLTRGLGLGFGFLMVLLGCVLWRTNFLEKKRRIKLKMQSTSSKRM
jgi:hypothetical protein